MKTSSEIKAMARESFHSRYWLCVSACVLYMLISFALAYTGVGSLILEGPLLIGMNFLFVNLFMGLDCDIGTMFSKAFEDFGRKLGGYLWMCLFLFLWALIPVAGVVIVIIKGLSYAMTSYILSDCPNVKAQDALKLSMRMMQGRKWDYFLFQLSFLGWHLLGALTGGMVSLFWTIPYLQSAQAGWYLERREECLRTGIITTAELDGAPLTEE